ncbi:MAG: AraC family transcriptional regulator [Fastidiosipilaceae bacterium]|jgi:AraC-like DNA-binding protein/mannose-6-phosphate isomerase-like protein (cupin superfamily)
MIQYWARADQSRVLANKNDVILRFVTKKNEDDYKKFMRTDHRHSDFMELTLVLEGEGYYSINDRIYPIKSCDLIICNVNTNHSDVIVENSNLTAICLGIANVKISTLPENTLIEENVNPILSLSESEYIRVNHFFVTCFNQLSNRNIYAEELCNSLISGLLITVLQIMNDVSPELSYRKENPLLTKTLAYINHNLYENLSLEKIADELFVSKYYMSHFFKAQTGYTPLQYIMRRRIGEAQSLLLSTDLSVTEIATRVGFNNSNQFYVQFKKYIGISPSLYKQHYSSK